MDNKWRPKEWKNPWNDPKNVVKFSKEAMNVRTKDGTSPEDVMRQDRRDIYEAGADAMLGMLKKDATYMNGDTIIPAQGEYPEIHCPGGMVGWLVFIPNKEDNGTGKNKTA